MTKIPCDGIKIANVDSIVGPDNNSLNIVTDADMQAALDAALADIDGGAPDTSYTDTIDGGTQ